MNNSGECNVPFGVHAATLSLRGYEMLVTIAVPFICTKHNIVADLINA
jgi:hypothetical protein